MILANNTLDNTTIEVLNNYIDDIQKCINTEYNLDVDIISYTGEISELVVNGFQELIEKTKNRDHLAIVLSTPGGSATAVEKMVQIIRHHYNEVYFIIPNFAMSAGTIFSMSGDKIFMDYASTLGPIDPQILNQDNRWVPALGYIDKVEEFISKSQQGTLTEAEFVMLQKLDLGTIRSYEQARDLSISLLKEWLVKYKFKNWNSHRTTNPGNNVTNSEKQERAEEIAKTLSDNKRWHSHGRHIGIETLRNELKLEIEDYSNKDLLRNSIMKYYKLLNDYVIKINRSVFLHANI